ncbi:MAG: T9SS type A sorting domain-containing protein [Bacteroidia bacterium]|nr:T9SS type A sorting domain-containing protein [Bacteroidia bacterium]
MMKKLLFFLILMSILGGIYSQNVTNWLFGAISSLDRHELVFNSGSPLLIHKEFPCYFTKPSSIQDENGEHIIYSNGSAVYNKWDKPLLNGIGINQPYYNLYDSLYGGYFNLILPYPDDSNKYYLFYNSLYESIFFMPTTPTFYGWGNGQKYVKYAIVDMSLNNDSGAVVLKNQYLITSAVDTLGNAPFAAVRHGNGQDWWLFIDRFRDDSVFCFRIDSQGIHGPYSQSTMGLIKRMPGWGAAGYMLFSPDGKKFAKVFPRNGLTIYDFDRCSGLLLNPIHLEYPTYYPGADTVICCPEQTPFGYSPMLQAIEFSANSKYLYWTGDSSLFQYDLTVADIPNSYIEVGSTPQNGMGFAKLGPDRKIYIWEQYGTTLHVINNPDFPGINCAFMPNQIDFSVTSSRTGSLSPFYPNYELGPLQGSLCDTINTVSIQEPYIESVKVYPNPASDVLTVEVILEGSATVLLFNALGQVVLQSAVLESGKTQIHLRGIPDGIYFYEVIDDKKVGSYGKVVIQRE